MVQHLADLAAVELEVRVGKVAETDHAAEDQQVGVVSLTLGLKGIVMNLITIGQVMDVVLLVPLMAVRVRSKSHMVAAQQRLPFPKTYLCNGKSLWCLYKLSKANK